MSQKIQTFFWIGITLLVVAGIGYYNIKPDMSDIAVVDEEIPIVIADDNSEKQDNIDKTDDIVVESGDTNNERKPIAGNVNAVAAIPVPDLDRPVIFPGGYSAEKAEEVAGQISILTDAIKADNDLFNEWLDLGMLRKSIEDYEGARQAWEYASAIRPGNSLSFVNLGMLYGYYLREPLKAEANLLHAIENEPRFLDFYARMTDFYIEVMNDKDKALGFLGRSIAQYPEWEDLKTLRGYVTK